MDFLDVILVIIIVAVIVRGARTGFVRQVVSLLGLLAGIVVGVWLIPIVVPFGVGILSKAVLTLLLFALTILLFGSLAELVGGKLARVRDDGRPPQLDRILGAILGAALIAISIWLAAAAFNSGPSKILSRQINGSLVVRTINHILPPAPAQLDKIKGYLSEVQLPKVFVGPEPQIGAAPNAPDQAAVDQVARTDAASVVEVTGYGCGGILEGSGFVVDNGLVMTNAHVVAGVRHPIIHDRNGSHTTVVVYFNPDLDLAILRSVHLAGAPLGIVNSDVSTGTGGAALGYPGGGPYTAVGASVVDRINAVGRNIYDQGLVRRSVYVLHADIEPGNSGGPLVLLDGRVIGVVFAKSADQSNTGYALTGSSITAPISAARNASTAVSTGVCAAD